MSDYPFDYNSYMNLLHDDDYIALYDYYSKETMIYPGHGDGLSLGEWADTRY